MIGGKMGKKSKKGKKNKEMVGKLLTIASVLWRISAAIYICTFICALFLKDENNPIYFIMASGSLVLSGLVDMEKRRETK